MPENRERMAPGEGARSGRKLYMMANAEVKKTRERASSGI
jgi:hypothetical protein